MAAGLVLVTLDTGSYLAVLSLVAVATLLVRHRGRGWAFVEDPGDASRWRSLRAFG